MHFLTLSTSERSLVSTGIQKRYDFFVLYSLKFHLPSLLDKLPVLTLYVSFLCIYLIAVLCVTKSLSLGYTGNHAARNVVPDLV